ncbi:AcrR family transcriptional regulator [Pseudoclavibacter sp. JAI123]|uniref:TetR/AcrR family transcriptional regulator n=1 Tax=Pseudoclavibacter sp. JAI123 TaxID=2723065 RepID=UPI0015CD1DEE|nr:TetR/AcrR family transcriptional regulator [Pseudoclavibacter sp. JAI123]NYF13689.1 AcrR family transcriptional regulator [Pseudoclavibacter sp. JAI123]
MSSTRAEIKRHTQTRVLDAAEQIFQEEGFAGASIRGIAKSAGVSAGTVISVGDKNALLVRVFDRLIEAEHDRHAAGAIVEWETTRPGSAPRIESRFAGSSTCSGRLVALASPFVAVFIRNDDLARVYASILVSGGHSSSLFSELAARLTEEFRTAISVRGCTPRAEAAQKAGALYFAFLGLLFTASARRTADPADLSADLHRAFAAICTCKEKE